MQTFEFHFNPKVKSDLVFDSFCFEPANIYEKRVGSLYMAGILKNALPQNARFLDNLAKVIRERYYKFTLKSPEKALREGLKSTNDFLDQVAKKGDVSWLGNLSFAILSFKGLDLNFTKVGDIKILLLRKGQIIDIDKRLKFQDLEPYPLKVFPNIVSGKLAESDVVLILTKETFNTFQSQNLLSEIAENSAQGCLSGRQLKEILQKKTEELSKIFGTCLLICLNPEEAPKIRQIITPKIKDTSKEFSLKAAFNPLLAVFKKFPRKINFSFRRFIPKFNLKNQVKILRIPHLPNLQPWKQWQISFASFSRFRGQGNRNLILISALIVFLGFGFFISQREENQKLNSYKTELEQIRKKSEEAENILIAQENNPLIKKRAADILNEAWADISSLVKITSTSPKNFRTQILVLQDEINNKLFELNKMVQLANPELILEVQTGQIIPQKIISEDGNVYLFSPYSQALVKILPDQTPENIPHNNTEKFYAAARLFNDSPLFFSKPGKVSLLKEEDFSESLLSLPPWDFSLDQFAVFNSNLYFFDGKAGKIVKYPYTGGFNWGEPEDWMQGENAIEAKSLAVDGSVWLLNPDNTLSRFYAGRIQETIRIDTFPQPKDFSKILIIPSLPYIYVLEPGQNRIIILNKSGQIIKQFQSEKFGTLLDFSVSEDGRNIYLLSGQKVYKIKTSDS